MDTVEWWEDILLRLLRLRAEGYSVSGAIESAKKGFLFVLEEEEKKKQNK